MRGGVIVTLFAQTDPGKVRSNNEDNFVVADLTTGEVHRGALDKTAKWELGPRGVLIAVSDGMGGEQAGEVASKIVIDSVLAGIQKAETISDKGDEIRLAIEAANAEVWEAAKEPGKKGMGATLTAIVIQGSTAFIAEVGDSRAYLLRGAQLRQVTRDQSYVQLLMDSGLLKPEDASSFPLKNVILQAMGHAPQVVVALGKLALRRGDRFLLCSDGLYGMLTHDDMRDAMVKSRDVEALTRALVLQANAAGGEDNITAIIADVHGDGVPVATSTERVTLTLEAVTEFQGTSISSSGDAPLTDESDHGISTLRPIEYGSLPKKSVAPPAMETAEEGEAAADAPPPSSAPASSPPKSERPPSKKPSVVPPPASSKPPEEATPKAGGSNAVWIALVVAVLVAVAYLYWRSR